MIEYISSVQEFEDFEKSGIWQDMVNELTLWVGRIRNELEDPEGKLPDKQLHRLGGSAEAIRMTLDLPETVRENIKASLEAKPSEEG